MNNGLSEDKARLAIYKLQNEKLKKKVRDLQIRAFIEGHQLPEDITIGELVEFCREQQWK